MIKKAVLVINLLMGFLLFTQSREEVINKWLNSEITHSDFISITIEELTSTTDSLEIAELYLNIGQAYYYQEKKEESIEFLEKGMNYAKQSIKEKESSEGWRIIADSGSYIMLQKGLGYIIKNSSKVQDYALKALELDNLNSRASLIDAQGLINAPKVFGGNKKKGISILEEQRKRDDLNREDRFFIEMALTQAYKGNKNPEAALEAINRALQIFPGNIEAQKIKEEI